MNLEQIEKIASNSYQRGQLYFKGLFSSGNLPKCSGGYISGSCAGGHNFAAPYLCGKEYCKDCGRDGSPIHARRLGRWQGLVDNWRYLGYLVITFPPSVRYMFTDKQVLADYRYQLRRKLQRLGYKQGLARWHYYGDCDTCSGDGCEVCNNTGAGRDFHPHLNIFIDKGYIKPEKLKAFIDDLSSYTINYLLGRLAKEKGQLVAVAAKKDWKVKEGLIEKIQLLDDTIKEVRATRLVINYSYTATEEKKINRLKYVLRSTFRIYNDEIKEALHNFRNCVRWGFSKAKGLIAEAITCEVCAAKGLLHLIRWTGKQYYTNNLNFINYDKGVFTLAPRGAPADRQAKRIKGQVPKRTTGVLSFRYSKAICA